MAPQHFLVVAFPGQGHINPTRALAERLARAFPGARVTLSAAVSAHRRMFPSLASPDEEIIIPDGASGISYVPHSDGYDDGFNLFAATGDEAWAHVETAARVGRATLSAALDRLAARGRPVTCVVYAMLMWWAADVARERGLPRALYWIQPATMLAVYYHYFHGYEGLITAHAGEPGFTVAMPGLPPMAIRELPSFFTKLADRTLAAAFDDIRKTFQQLDLDTSTGEKPMVLVNTVEALEAGVLASLPGLDLFPVGPAVVSLFADTRRSPGTDTVRDLYEHDDEKRYMEWLDTKPARSVVYVSFGSMSAVSKRQKQEIKRGLAAAGRPYLWVIRKNNRDADEDGDSVEQDAGMVVEWCDQVRVLEHGAVGCFVTHNGWNSTSESLAAGVPMVCWPGFADQFTNCKCVCEVWGVGLRLDAEVKREQVAGHVRKAMEAEEMRRSAVAWKAKAAEAVSPGGSSFENLQSMVKALNSV